MWDKMRSYREHVEEHIKNLSNVLGTRKIQLNPCLIGLGLISIMALHSFRKKWKVMVDKLHVPLMFFFW
jgi:hypothetical protein